MYFRKQYVHYMPLFYNANTGFKTGYGSRLLADSIWIASLTREYEADKHRIK